MYKTKIKDSDIINVSEDDGIQMDLTLLESTVTSKDTKKAYKLYDLELVALAKSDVNFSSTLRIFNIRKQDLNALAEILIKFSKEIE